MRRLAFLLLLLSPCVYGAVYSTSVGEIRATATAGGLNSGWFDLIAASATGVDYTQQDTFVSSGAILASTDGAGPSSCTVTAAGYSWGNDVVGNSLHVTAGTNWNSTGANSFHIIISTVTNGLVLNGNCGTANSLSNGTFYLGGGFSGNSTLDLDFLLAANSSTAESAPKIWVKGDITQGETISGLTAGSIDFPVVIEGYATTRGDWPTGSTRPTWAIGTGAFTVAADWWIKNISFTGSGATMMTLGTNDALIDCKFLNNSTTANRQAVTMGNATGRIIRGELTSLRGNAIGSSSGASIWQLYGSYIHHSNIGLTASFTTGSLTAYKTIFAVNLSSAVNNAGANTIPNLYIDNTFYGYGAGKGVGISVATGASRYGLFMGNSFSNLHEAILIADAQGSAFSRNNNFYGNAIANTNFTTAGLDTTLDPAFANVVERSGTTASTTAGNHLVQTGALFQTWGVTTNDYVCLISGTGTTNFSCYTILEVEDEETLETGETLAANATTDKVWFITQGMNFSPGANLKGRGFPGTAPGGFSLGFDAVGAVQPRDAPRAVAQ